MVIQYSGDFGSATLDLVGHILIAEIILNDGSSFLKDFDSVSSAEDFIYSEIQGD